MSIRKAAYISLLFIGTWNSGCDSGTPKQVSDAGTRSQGMNEAPPPATAPTTAKPPFTREKLRRTFTVTRSVQVDVMYGLKPKHTLAEADDLIAALQTAATNDAEYEIVYEFHKYREWIDACSLRQWLGQRTRAEELECWQNANRYALRLEAAAKSYKPGGTRH